MNLSKSFSALLLILVILAADGRQFELAAASASVGQPLISGRDPAVQEEKDWVDNRWSRSDVGQFLASNLQVPGGRVLKALSIKVGEHDEGAVCFDTGNCTLRAGWLG